MRPDGAERSGKTLFSLNYPRTVEAAYSNMDRISNKILELENLGWRCVFPTGERRKTS